MVKKKTRRKPRRSKTLAASNEADEPMPLMGTELTIENEADEGRPVPAAEARTKTWRRMRRRKSATVVTGSHEAGEQGVSE